MPRINELSVDGMTINSIERKSPDAGRTGPIDAWQLVALFEILTELRRLNALLHCSNFTGMPAQLRKVARNTSPPPVRRKKRVP